jgi:hypothetical protein
MASHIPAFPTNYPGASLYSEIGNCTPGLGVGIPTAHVPVNAVTAAAYATSYINGYYGSVTTKTTSSPLSETLSTSTLGKGYPPPLPLPLFLD